MRLVVIPSVEQFHQCLNALLLSTYQDYGRWTSVGSKRLAQRLRSAAEIQQTLNPQPSILVTDQRDKSGRSFNFAHLNLFFPSWVAQAGRVNLASCRGRYHYAFCY